jgi:hypothetical protein
MREEGAAEGYVSIRQHTSAYVRGGIRQHRSAMREEGAAEGPRRERRVGSIRQHTSAYVSIRQHTSAYLRRGYEVGERGRGHRSEVLREQLRVPEHT